jgi:hypothetical protein
VSSVKTWTNSFRNKSDPETGLGPRAAVGCTRLHASGVTLWRMPIQLAESLRSRIGTKRSSISDVCVPAPPPPPVHPRGGRREEHCPTRRPEGTPLAGALALHGVSGDSGSHLGSTLKPGGAVLTLGVFRRSRSVACIRADASPSEVHVNACVNLCWQRHNTASTQHPSGCRKDSPELGAHPSDD